MRQPSDPKTPLWTIVDGASTDGSDILRMLEVSKGTRPGKRHGLLSAAPSSPTLDTDVQDGLHDMLYFVLVQPDKPLHISGFSRGAYAAMIAAYVLHTLTGIRPLLVVGDPVIGHTARMPRQGFHSLLLRVLVSRRQAL